jgi:hypothetical protein
VDGEDLRQESLLMRKSALLSLLKAAPHGILFN